MMNEQSFGTYAKEFKKDISAYIELRLEYTKLIAYEKVAKVSAVSLSFLVILFFAFFAFFFLSFAGGYYIGSLTGNNALGFGIISLVYIVLLVVVLVLRKKYFEKVIIEKIVDVLIEEDESN